MRLCKDSQNGAQTAGQEVDSGNHIPMATSSKAKESVTYTQRVASLYSQWTSTGESNMYLYPSVLFLLHQAEFMHTTIV